MAQGNLLTAQNQILMVWVNYLRRFQLRQSCCGNYGEPGC